ncbi:type I secretion C-terminal target domain-containing protein [Aromatoleum toluclasticum]|nr:type I secretion C-terminal target domain-containing protein [Aromatoleum toluclasticum]
MAQFSVSQNDKLDLRDLLQGEHSGLGVDASNLSQYLHLDVESGKVVLSVDHDAGTFAATQKVVFDNYTSLASLGADLGLSGTITSDAIINKMVQDGRLLTDS